MLRVFLYHNCGSNGKCLYTVSYESSCILSGKEIFCEMGIPYLNLLQFILIDNVLISDFTSIDFDL